MLTEIEKIIRHAADIMQKARGAAAHEKEGHNNFVTDADIAVQNYLQKALKELLPESCFFAEEKDDNSLTDAPTWVVDPIDGTLNYMHDRHCSAISIALLRGREPVLGMIYNPYLDEVFSAEKGKGARMNGEKIHVSTGEFAHGMIIFGTAPYRADLREETMRIASAFLRDAGDLRRSGSAAIDLCDLAAGRAEAFFELTLAPWDYAAGSLILREAGGHFTMPDEPAIQYDHPAAVLASNDTCYAPAQALFAASRE